MTDLVTKKTPKSAAERMRLKRQRQKEKDPDYQQKENECMRLLRQKKKEAMSQSELKDQRFKESEASSIPSKKAPRKGRKTKVRTRQSRSLQVTKVIW